MSAYVAADAIRDASRPALSPRQRRALDIANDLMADHGKPAPGVRVRFKTRSPRVTLVSP